MIKAGACQLRPTPCSLNGLKKGLAEAPWLRYSCKSAGAPHLGALGASGLLRLRWRGVHALLGTQLLVSVGKMRHGACGKIKDSAGQPGSPSEIVLFAVLFAEPCWYRLGFGNTDVICLRGCYISALVLCFEFAVRLSFVFPPSSLLWIEFILSFCCHLYLIPMNTGAARRPGHCNIVQFFVMLVMSATSERVCLGPPIAKAQDKSGSVDTASADEFEAK